MDMCWECVKSVIYGSLLSRCARVGSPEQFCAPVHIELRITCMSQLLCALLCIYSMLVVILSPVTVWVHDDLNVQKGRPTRTESTDTSGLFIPVSKVCLQFAARNVMFSTEETVLMKSFPAPFVMPLRGNESDCNLVFHFPFFIAPHTHTYVHTGA